MIMNNIHMCIYIYIYAHNHTYMLYITQYVYICVIEIMPCNSPQGPGGDSCAHWASPWVASSWWATASTTSLVL